MCQKYVSFRLSTFSRDYPLVPVFTSTNSLFLLHSRPLSKSVIDLSFQCHEVDPHLISSNLSSHRWQMAELRLSQSDICCSVNTMSMTLTPVSARKNLHRDLRQSCSDISIAETNSTGSSISYTSCTTNRNRTNEVRAYTSCKRKRV